MMYCTRVNFKLTTHIYTFLVHRLRIYLLPETALLDPEVTLKVETKTYILLVIKNG